MAPTSTPSNPGPGLNRLEASISCPARMLGKAFKKSLDSKHNEIEQIYVDGVVEGFSPVSLGDSVENPACDLRRGTKRC